MSAVSPLLLQYVIPAFIGLLAGAVGSVIAPWVNWGIKKRELKLHARREFLFFARNAVREHGDKRAYREHVTYSQLRPFLSQRSIEMIESDAAVVQADGRGSGADNFKPLVYEDINKLEKKWGLL